MVNCRGGAGIPWGGSYSGCAAVVVCEGERAGGSCVGLCTGGGWVGGCRRGDLGSAPAGAAVGWAAVVGLWGSVERHLMVEGVSVQGMLGAGLRVPCFQRGWQCCLFLWASLRLWDEG